MTIERNRIRHKTHRLIASKYPTIGVFDDLTEDAEDLRVAFVLESMTNDRLLLLRNRINLIPNEAIVSGATASLVMAAFLHADDKGGRFNSGKLGVWYGSLDVQTAVAETFHHSDRRLRLSDGAFPSKIQVRELIVQVDLNLVDIRGGQKNFPDLYHMDPARYERSQKWADALRWPSKPDIIPEQGVVYDSVRRKNGTNICIFWPTGVTLPVHQGDHYEYNWDKTGETQILKLTNVDI